MAFPDTRLTLIERLANNGDETDWSEFVCDYWGPVCRFVRRQSGLTHEDAEDIASLTFEITFKKKLLEKWVSNRSAKLRTLLCAVIRNTTSNLVRVREGRARLLRDEADRFDERFVLRDLGVPSDQERLFYDDWAAEIIRQAMDEVMTACHCSGRGDYFRVFYGRFCERMTIREIAEHLDISQSTADNYFRSVRKQLQQRLESIIRSRVERYSPPAEVAREFEAEWADLAEHLRQFGGLEAAVERAFGKGEQDWNSQEQQTSMNRAIDRLSGVIRLP